MKKLLFIAASIIYSSATFASGIPTVDAVGNAQELVHWLEKVKQWENTVIHYDKQINAYKNQLATATGIRNVQLFLRQAKNLAKDIENLRERGISLNDLLTDQSLANSSELNNLYGKYKIFDSCNENAKGNYLDTCKKMVINNAVAIEDTTAIQKQISAAISDISELSNRISESTDSKESQDLANVVTAKSVQLNALSSQWEMSVKQSELRNQMLANQRQKAFQEQQLKAPVADLNNIRN